MTVELLTSPEAVVVIEGRFGQGEMLVLAKILSEQPEGTTMRLDLTRVRELDDAALVALVRIVRASTLLVRVEGLSDHQRTLLGYFKLLDHGKILQHESAAH